MTAKILPALLLLASASGTHATTITVNSFDTGWYDENGFQAAESATTDSPYPYNTYTGDSGGVEFRSFYNFNVSALSAGAVISSATVTFSSGNGQYRTNDLTETVELYDVTNLPGDHNATQDSGKAIFSDLGTGVLYGTHVLSTPDYTPFNLIPEFSIDLSSVSFTDIGSNSFFSLGARLTTAKRSEGIWATPYFPSNQVQHAASLTIEYEVPVMSAGSPVVPVAEPSTLALLTIGLAGFGFNRRKKHARTLAD